MYIKLHSNFISIQDFAEREITFSRLELFSFEHFLREVFESISPLAFIRIYINKSN